MKFLVGLLVFFFVLFGSISLFIQYFSFPNIYVGSLLASIKTRPQVESLIRRTYEKPITIKIKNRMYPATFKSLGIVIDEEKTTDDIFAQNTITFPQNIFVFFNSFSHKTIRMPHLVFTKEFDSKMQNTIYNFSQDVDKVQLDQEKKQLLFTDNDERYKIDSPIFKDQLLISFGNKITTVVPSLSKVNTGKKEKIENYNNLLATVYQNPVSLVIENDQATATYVVSAAELKEIVSVEYVPTNDKISFTLDQQAFTKVFADKIKNIQQSNSDKKVNITKLQKDLLSLFSARFDKVPTTDVLSAKTQFTPHTTGVLAQKYIEVDIGQQMMYLWEGGNNIASYIVSTGLYLPTPPGSYKILNKAPNAYSDLYNVWMPYWMAFYLEPHVHAYLGIHELPYWVTNNGQEIRRPRNFLGSPHTGGCISLDIGIAKKVYEFADVGMPVYVFN